LVGGGSKYLIKKLSFFRVRVSKKTRRNAMSIDAVGSGDAVGSDFDVWGSEDDLLKEKVGQAASGAMDFWEMLYSYFPSQSRADEWRENVYLIGKTEAEKAGKTYMVFADYQGYSNSGDSTHIEGKIKGTVTWGDPDGNKYTWEASAKAERRDGTYAEVKIGQDENKRGGASGEVGKKKDIPDK
jgi:hypothetical protein